jgi:hypothetical protein
MGLNLDIDVWLRGIGLEQYAQTFRDNAIDVDVLCDLTDEHGIHIRRPERFRLFSFLECHADKASSGSLEAEQDEAQMPQ